MVWVLEFYVENNITDKISVITVEVQVDWYNGKMFGP